MTIALVLLSLDPSFMDNECPFVCFIFVHGRYGMVRYHTIYVLYLYDLVYPSILYPAFFACEEGRLFRHDDSEWRSTTLPSEKIFMIFNFNGT